MRNVCKWFQIAIQKCQSWYYFHPFHADAEERWWEKCQQQWVEDERLYTEFVAQCELEDDRGRAKEEEYAEHRRKRDLELREEQAERERLDEIEDCEREEEYNQYYCPLCGSRWSNGRCKACDRAFGRD